MPDGYGPSLRCQPGRMSSPNKSHRPPPRVSEGTPVVLQTEEMQNTLREGIDENSPIILDRDPQAFKIFLLTIHAFHVKLGKDFELHVKVLDLSRYLLSESLRQHTIISFEAEHLHVGTSPIKVIELCFEYGIREFFSDTFRELNLISWSLFSQAETLKIPQHVTDAVIRLRESLRATHDANIALESPEMDGKHAVAYQDNVACTADWHQLWFNVIGASLLNGRQHIGWVTAQQRFLGLGIKAGRVNGDTWARKKTRENVRGNRYQAIFAGPEMWLKNASFRKTLRQSDFIKNTSAIVIDEAHCITSVESGDSLSESCKSSAWSVSLSGV
ncbi:hypothetical protein C8J56DRAFT_1081604 [Mycena floridula]|nr:hypothetical protein C8J56DRAFT_1081604 [Mycena floridula]